MLTLPFGQQFQATDLASVAALVVLEALLSADNALVLAIMVKHLSKADQKKALLYGLGGAFFFRFIAILFATIILQQWWLQALGAAYLILMTLKHFLSKNHDGDEKKDVQQKSFWLTVLAVELTDVAFAIDSVLAGITFVGGKQEKIWVVFFGAIIGIVLLRFAATFFIKLLAKYPTLDHVAYAIVGWVGIKLAFISAHSWSVNHPNDPQVPELPTAVFWAVLLTIAIFGSMIASRHGIKKEGIDDELSDLIDDASDLSYDQHENTSKLDTNSDQTKTEENA
jgi:YkoY family integral membrane protein